MAPVAQITQSAAVRVVSSGKSLLTGNFGFRLIGVKADH